MKVVIGQEAEKVLSPYVGFAKSQFVTHLKDIKIKTPLVLKIISPQAVHKTEIGGVVVVKHSSSLESSFNDLAAKVKKYKLKEWKIQAQEYHSGIELVVGIKKDPAFSHVIVLGLGGIYTEALKDISIRKCPITESDAQSMIDELRCKDIINGVRGAHPSVKSLIKTLVRVSTLSLKNKSIQELDLNPIILTDKEACAVDARIVL